MLPGAFRKMLSMNTKYNKVAGCETVPVTVRPVRLHLIYDSAMAFLNLFRWRNIFHGFEPLPIERLVDFKVKSFPNSDTISWGGIKELDSQVGEIVIGEE